MKKLVLPALAIFALAFVAVDADSAEAAGLHFRVGRLHLDVGHPHHSCGGAYGGGYWGGHRVWHDTTHLDYHPGRYVRHRNHYHYIPGHYHVHHTGHWDYYRW